MLSDSVMICQWAKLFTQLMRSRMRICSGVSNGSAALATIRAFPASPRSMFVSLFGAAPQRREEPAPRTSAFLSSREENGEDRCWSAALRLDRFRLAEAPAHAERNETLARIVFGAGFPLILLLKHCRFTSSTTAATSGLSA